MARKPHASKKPREVDLQVGQNIRVHRVRMGFSQTDLANRIGVTFQQVQKYEKGTNRIAPSRLHEIAAMLDVPVAALFPQGENGGPLLASEFNALEILTTPRGQRLARAYQIIPAHMRDHVVAVVEALAGITDYLQPT